MTNQPFRQFVRELKRRRVFRVAAVYAAVAFLVVEAADIIVPAVHLPSWVVTLLVVAAGLGFPVAVVLAWAYDLTPEGARRAEPPAEPPSGGPRGVPRAVAVAVVAGGLGLAAYAYLGTPAGSSDRPADRSIAVLPFTNLSEDPENEYFSDGITDDILTHLARLGDLRVISRTSVMPYKEAQKSLPQIARELDVAYVLEGSVRRSDDRVRITAQLIRAEDDGHLWAETYDRRLEDIFAIQSDIAQEIAHRLEAELSPAERERIETRPTEDMAAYDLYLRGRESYFRHTEADMKRAVEYFREAIQRDPGFALGYAGLADAFAVLEGYHDLGEEWLDSAVVAGLRAVLLDPGVAEAYTAMSHAYWIKGHSRLALELNDRALALKPNYPHGYWNASMIHSSDGRLLEALRDATRAQALDPGSPWVAGTLGWIYKALGADREAERSFGRALALQPDFEWAQVGALVLYRVRGELDRAEAVVDAARRHDPDALAWAERRLALEAGDVETARRLFEEALRSPREQPELAAPLAFLYRETGDDAAADSLLRWTDAWKDDLDAQVPGHVSVEYDRAQIAALEGDVDAALRHLRAALAADFRYHRWLRVDPLLKDLRADPRYEALSAEAEAAVEAERERAERAGLL